MAGTRKKRKNTPQPVKVTVYRWAGHWGPFRIKIPCGECSLTGDVIRDTIENELSGVPVEVETRDWLNEWHRPLRRGGWHAPIVLVEGRVISQGLALNRGVLTQAVIEAWAGRLPVGGNHLFGKGTALIVCGPKHCWMNAGSTMSIMMW